MGNFFIVGGILLILGLILYFYFKNKKLVSGVSDETTDVIGDEWKNTDVLKDKKDYIDNTLKEIKNEVINNVESEKPNKDVQKPKQQKPANKKNGNISRAEVKPVEKPKVPPIRDHKDGLDA